MIQILTSHRSVNAGHTTAFILCALLFAGLVFLSGCGGGSSSPIVVTPLVAGNWQFTLAGPGDNSFVGGLQGGFLLQDTNGSIKGGATYSVAIPQSPPTPPRVCSSGSAPITGNLNGQSVTFSAVAGNQTFNFTGTLSTDNSTMVGTYTTSDGTASDGSPCGTSQTGLQWSATLVPPLTGPFHGSLHSTNGANGLQNLYFPAFGMLTQDENKGASSATVSGTLTFLTNQFGSYPCFDTATLTGQISGNNVILQIFTSNGIATGQIGGISPTQPVTFDSVQGGFVLRDLQGGGYAVNTKACPGVSLANAGDSGNLCLAMGDSNACSQPITLSPAFLTFPGQTLGSSSATQTITLTNTDPANTTLDGLSILFLTTSGSFGTESDFNGLPNFTEKDDCGPFPGSPFSLLPQQTCTIKVTFSPQQSCPWLPYGAPPFGSAPVRCPVPSMASLTVNSPKSADNNTSFAVKVTGLASSAIVPSTPELDFGAQPVGGATPSQTLSFTNRSNSAVQILSAASTPCTNAELVNLPHPIRDDGTVDGIRVARTDSFASIQPNPPSVTYFCDVDATSGQPNFRISSNTCMGRLLASQDTCSMQIAFVPQPGTNLAGTQGAGLDYFLELNTLQCSVDDNITSNCEIDSGRFPVEIKANPPSPLRMSPGAGLDFPAQTVGTTSAPLKIALFNDAVDPNSAVVNISGVALKGDYAETDDCPAVLNPGNGCTLTFTFKPKVVGSDPGSATITYNGGQFQTIYLRGLGQ